MSLLVVRLALEELLERTDRRFRLLPIELERGELLRRRHQLAVGLLALALDPGRGEVREKATAMRGNRRAQMLDRVSRSTCVACLAAAAQRPPEHLEIHVDRRGQRQPVPRVRSGYHRRL